MKKQYEPPKAEKMEFSYTETVVASGQCDYFYTLTQHEDGCKSKLVEQWNKYGV